MDTCKGKEGTQIAESTQGNQTHASVLAAQSNPMSVSDEQNSPTAPPAPRRAKTLDAADQDPGRRRPDPNRRTHSHVSVDFFDPRGVRQLSRALSHMPEVEPVSSREDTEVSREESERRTSEGTLLSGEQFDFETAVRAYLKKREESDIKPRQLGVLFEDLRVVGLGASARFQQTLGSIFNPMNILPAIRSARHPPLRDILTDFEGVVRPGEMLLVLGRPGSGCTTLLKILANRRHEYHSVHGSVYYDSLTPSQVRKHYRGDVQYCPEDDILFPTLTVDQTIHFAAQTRAPSTRIAGQTRKEYTRRITDVYATIFGLQHCRNTLVGDAALRGVSGGEKKRVSISETLATRSLITSWDNSTRGLDASTALEFARALRIATNLVRVSTIVSIYQAGEALYNIFDKVCLIYEGRMVFFGPVNKARAYFEEMGYVPKPRQTTPDFLVAVTDPAGRTAELQNSNQTPYEDRYEGNSQGSNERSRSGPIPQTALEFVEYYKNSEIRKRNLDDMEAYKREFVNKPERVEYYKESTIAEHARFARRKSVYHINPYATQVLQIVVFVLQAVILGTTFARISDATSAYFSRGGVIFFSLFAPTLFSMTEIPSLFAQRPIMYQQDQAAMYHPMIEALAMTIVDLPFAFFTIVLFVILIYFIVGLQTSAWQFFTFFLFTLTVSISMRAFFRALAAAFPSAAPAQTVAGILLLALSLYTGYQIPRPNMIGALRWISYINPIFYGFNSLMSNEFETINGPCSSLVPSGAGYEGVSITNQVCSVVGAEPGETSVSGPRYVQISFGYYFSQLWRNYAILCAFGIFFILCLLLFTEYNTRISQANQVVQFKRGSRAAVIEEAVAAVGSDEEKRAVISEQTAVKEAAKAEAQESKKQAEEALKEQPEMMNVFSWQHIDYVIPVHGGDTQKLLNDVFGYVAPGKLTALMGESGAGKTTLLNVLAERIEIGVVTGSRFFNGQPLPADFQAQAGYCQQLDTHEPTSTVREALRFSARLRQPSSISVEEKDTYADKCLEMCGLGPFADAIVGTLGLEERKRTTIGVELAAKPKLLLFLDEPTSGLDSQSAWAIVSFLRTLADNGQAILCTIHQPSAELFSVFDRLLLLQKGGQTVYFGDIGSNATTLIKYFETAGGRPCEPGENPAEYMLEVIGAGATAVVDLDWHQVWLDSAERQQLVADLEHIIMEGKKQPPVPQTLHGTFAAPWTFQTRILLERQFNSYWRNPTYLMSKLTLNAFGGLFIGFTFFKANDTIQANQDKLFAIFMGTILSAPLGGQVHVPYINMRTIYEIRERPSRMYNWSALTTSQLICEIPWNILGAFLFFVCWYWTVGFASSRGGFTYFVYGVQFPLFWTTIALAVASMSPTAEIAGLLYSFLFTFIFTFNGVLQPFRQLGWWRWMYHVSPYTYLIEALLGQAVGGQEINCAAKEIVTLDPPSGQTCTTYLQQYISRVGGYVINPDATTACQYCSARTTDQWMGPNFNIYYDRHWRDFGIFWCYIAFNAVAVYVFTYFIRVQSHRGLTRWIRQATANVFDRFKFLN